MRSWIVGLSALALAGSVPACGGTADEGDGPARIGQIGQRAESASSTPFRQFGDFQIADSGSGKKGETESWSSVSGGSDVIENVQGVGKITSFTLYSDFTGGVGRLCVSVDANGRCNSVMVAIGSEHNVLKEKVTIRPERHSIDGTDVSIPSTPNSPLTGLPWEAKLDIQLKADGSARTSIVQLVDFNGIDTVSANATRWVDMTPSPTAVCITSNDCTRYGLDTSNGPFSCVNNTCVQAPPIPCPECVLIP